MAFSITTEAADGTATVYLSGWLDAAAQDEFEKAVLPYAADAAVSRLVLDGRRLDSIASAGLRVLLKAVKAVLPRGAGICCVGFRPAVKEVLRLAGFLRYLEFRDE